MTANVIASTKRQPCKMESATSRLQEVSDGQSHGIQVSGPLWAKVEGQKTERGMRREEKGREGAEGREEGARRDGD